MALIRSMTQQAGASRPHPTLVDCAWQTFEHDGVRYLQLSTFGSDNRVSLPKVSQTIQFNAATASQLRDAIDKAFPGTGS